MRWETDVPLSAWTRYRIGGPAPRFAVVEGRRALREALLDLGGAPHRVVGGGANLLVADRGVDEAVLKLGEGFDYIRFEEGGLEAGAAAALPALARAARRRGLEGFVALEAVPGTVGGGLRMNAGSREEWLWHRVVSAEAMTPEGEVMELSPADAEPGYRRVDVPESWVFLGAHFEGPAGDPGEVERAHLEFRRRKVEAQVYDLRSVGSIWKNPGKPHGPAWRVVERVGMRGARRGGAQVSEKHANFIVNLGEATAADVLGLMAEIHRLAREELGVGLEPEIQLWGFTEEELRSVGAAPGEARAKGAR